MAGRQVVVVKTTGPTPHDATVYRTITKQEAKQY
jgi:hypothetical protein